LSVRNTVSVWYGWVIAVVVYAAVAVANQVAVVLIKIKGGVKAFS
jgi:hypothetical protein